MQQLPKQSPEDRQREARAKFLGLILDSPENIRRRFAAKPITLLKLIDENMRFPRKLRRIFACLWLQQDLDGNPATRFIIKGPRGGGKSVMLGALGFVKWYLQLRKIVDMGGSLQQAEGVYKYFSSHIYAQDTILDALPSEPTMHYTETEHGNFFKAVAASSKQVRGPHPDCLFIDEACEAKDEIILSALPTVSTSEHQLIVLTSTFHKIFGYFQETWDNAPALGYVRMTWDMFDVCKMFDPAIWDDPKLNREIPDLAVLKARATGRTGDPEGWVPIANIIQAWREKPSIDWFDVEYMGLRPSAEGMVNNPEDVDACVIDDFGEYAHVAGASTAGGVDWGFSGMTVLDVEMAYKDNIKVELECEIYSQVMSDVICEDAAEMTVKYRIPIWHVDASHPFENATLRKAVAARIAKLPEKEQFRCSVVEVPFGRPVEQREADGTKSKTKRLGTEKDEMLGNYRAYFSRRLNRIPRKNKVGIWQHKRYRYQKNSDKPVKEDDHCPDAKMLALRRWPLGKTVQSLPSEETHKRRVSTATGGLMSEVF